MSAGGGRRQRFDAQEEIKRVILDRGLTAGCAIPTESELVAQLGISRGSLREALKGLQARGIIEVQHGRGMFVAHPSMDSLVDGLIFRGRLDGQRDDLTTASELVDGRDILESALVQKVAARADPTLIAALDTTVQRMEDAAAAGESFQDSDRLFHEQLYSGLDNLLVIQLVRAFWEVLDAVRPQLASGISDAVTDARHHRVILDRIRVGDQDGARQAMAEHFRATHLWIQGGRMRSAPAIGPPGKAGAPNRRGS
jgi:DNA-binding FadR family transcriptional regulator